MPTSAPHRSRRNALVLGVALAAGGLASCGSPDPERSVVDIELGRYTITPAELAAPAGKFAIRVTNVDAGLVHSLVVAGWGTRQLAPGESQTVPVEIDAGEYQMWCDVPGHAALGQVGVLRTGSTGSPAASVGTATTGTAP